MKYIKLFEFKGELENPMVIEFLNKVRKENFELLGTFRSIIINKGIDIAKEKYKQYDPIEIKKKKQRESTKKWYQNNKDYVKHSRERKKQYEEEGIRREEEIENQLMIPIKNSEYKKEIAKKFVEFLPDFFPDQMKATQTIKKIGIDIAYYSLLDYYIDAFEERFKLNLPVWGNDEEFEEFIENMMFDRFGHAIEF